MIRVTQEMLLAARWPGKGWSKEQAAALGVPWPLQRGWFADIVDREITEEAYETLRKLSPPMPAAPAYSPFASVNAVPQEEIKRLDLSSITLWTVYWGDSLPMLGRILRVLRYCNRICLFERTVLFHTSALPVLAPYDQVRVQCGSWGEFNRLVNEFVPQHIHSEFALAVQEDGFPLHPELWSSEFLDYDYIGAPWPKNFLLGDTTFNVGNGGFCLESQKLLRLKLELPPNLPPHRQSDLWICRTHRPWLEQKGIRFAPAELAATFSTELCNQDQPAFGFHGRTYNPRGYAEGWARIQKLGV